MKVLESLGVAIAQVAPIYLDLEASLELAEQLIAEAAARGARLIVFGETWLPGYPAWLDYCSKAALWDHEPTKNVYATLRRNSVSVPGAATTRLANAARKHQLVLVIGINERKDEGPGNGTLYNTLLTFDSDGSLLNHHRKLVPTYTERLVWGQGNGAGLQGVSTSVGRISGLICWEHWMPLARQVLHTAGELIHIAVWPTVHEMHQIASRHYAFEGRCFVIAAGLIMKKSDLPGGLGVAESEAPLVLRGGSAVIGPNGQYVVEPVFDEEQMIFAQLNLNEIDKERMTLDVTGHYHRPDVFDVKLNLTRKSGD